jgi:hypothetical protein
VAGSIPALALPEKTEEYYRTKDDVDDQSMQGIEAHACF